MARGNVHFILVFFVLLFDLALLLTHPPQVRLVCGGGGSGGEGGGGSAATLQRVPYLVPIPGQLQARLSTLLGKPLELTANPAAATTMAFRGNRH